MARASDDQRETRIAEHEATFRRANEKLREMFESHGEEGRYPFLCECGDVRCTFVVRASLQDYAAVRAHATRFLIVPGHRQLESERVVEGTGEFEIVEKSGRAGDLVRSDWTGSSAPLSP